MKGNRWDIIIFNDSHEYDSVDCQDCRLRAVFSHSSSVFAKYTIRTADFRMDQSAHNASGTSKARRVLCLSILFVGNIFAFCCISLIGPFFPFEAEKKGASETIVGIIFSCPELVVFLTSPQFGALLSQVNPTFMCVSGLWVFGSCVALFGWLSESPPGWTFIGLCIAARVVEALGTASYMTSCMTIAGGLFPDSKPRIYALLHNGVGVGFAIGPAIGSFLYEWGGYTLPFWAMAGCVFLVGVAVLIFLPRHQHNGDNTQVSLQSTFLLMRSPLVIVGFVILTCVCYVFSVWVPGYAQYLQQFGLKTSVIGLLFLIMGFTYSIATPFLSWLISTKMSVIPVVVTSLVLQCVAMLLYGPAPFLTFLPRVLWLPVFSTVCVAVFNSCLYTGGVSCVLNGVRDLGMKDDSQTQGLVSGLIMSAVSLGQFTGPLVGGALTDYFGFAWATTSGAVFCLITLLVFTSHLCVRHMTKTRSITDSEKIQLDKRESSNKTNTVVSDNEKENLIKPRTK